MKLARAQVGSQIVLAQIEDDGATALMVDDNVAWTDPLRTWLDQGRPTKPGPVIDISEASLLAPIRNPSKIVAVGLNYRAHAREQGRPLPVAPMLFSKAPSSITGPGSPIRFAADASQAVDYENELGVVIGRRTRNVTVDDALASVLGYTVCNDVSARDLQRSDGQFFRAKSFDTFCPVGPVIVTTDEIPDPQALALRTSVNGELRQDGKTSDMVFGVAEIISYASRYFTLEPGDLVITGTPAGVGEARVPPVFLQHGDTVQCEIDGIGSLINRVEIV